VHVVGVRKATIITVMFSLFLVGSMSGTVLAQEENWVEVARFTGSGDESIEKEPFEIGHVDWRIGWEYTPLAYTVFTLVTHNDTNIEIDRVHKVFEFTVNAADTNGTSYMYDMNGTFYLSIQTVNTRYYNVVIEQNIESIPEFPSWIILPLLLVVTFVAILAKKRLH